VDSTTETICVRRIVNASKETAFKAWTESSQVTKWWNLGEGWTTPSAELDPKVGGKISLGNQPSGGGVMLITGEYLRVEPPDRLVYTFLFPGAIPEESIVTVEFNALGDKQTEIVVTHEMGRGMVPNAIAGWNSALESLSNFLG
jgi:uncharacterized protein YndB with AHSA1/START domain